MRTVPCHNCIDSTVRAGQRGEPANDNIMICKIALFEVCSLGMRCPLAGTVECESCSSPSALTSLVAIRRFGKAGLPAENSQQGSRTFDRNNMLAWHNF